MTVIPTWLLRSVVAFAVLVAVTATDARAEGSIYLFSRNGGPTDNMANSRRVAIVAATRRQTLNCTKKGDRNNFCQNDEARSAYLWGPLRRGWKMMVFDNSDGKRSDDWAEIEVLRDIPNGRAVTIGTFEHSTVVEGSVKVTFHRATKGIRKNGLDGKVSRVEIAPP